MMELYDKYKVLRDALEQIKGGKGTTVYAIRQHAEAALQRATAIGPVAAAQPEGEAAPDWRAIAEGRALELCDLKERAEKAEAETARCAKEWADAVALRQPAPQAVSGAIGAADPEAVFSGFCERQGYPSDSEMDAPLRAAFYAGIEYCCQPVQPIHSPAPQAGDALGRSIDTPRFQTLAHNYRRYQTEADLGILIDHINASRREAYDNGRAEGLGQVAGSLVEIEGFAAEDGVDGHHKSYGNGVFFTHNCARTFYAAPPASAAQHDPIVELNVAMLRSRSAVGIAKYGTTLAGNPLQLVQWLQHALEEQLDQANYIQSAIQNLRANEASE